MSDSKPLFRKLSPRYELSSSAPSILLLRTQVSVSYGSGRLSCGWLGVLCTWPTHATVGSGRGWLGMVAARQPDLRLGAMGRCASTAGRSSANKHQLETHKVMFCHQALTGIVQCCTSFVYYVNDDIRESIKCEQRRKIVASIFCRFSLWYAEIS